MEFSRYAKKHLRYLSCLNLAEMSEHFMEF